ncbi:MAG: OadG family transporter subunit [Eubacteriales bacterium]
MRKKISLLLLALICTFSLAGCTSSESAEQDVTTITQLGSGLTSIFASMDQESMDYYIEGEEFDISTILYDSGIPSDGYTFSEVVSAWSTGLQDCGTFIQINGDYEAEVDGTEVTLVAEASYSERDAKITYIFDDGRLESLTIDPVYSFNEIIMKAVLNTLLGMGTVFLVLIFIAFIISLFKYIPALEEKFKKKAAPVAAAPVVVEPVVAVAETSVSAELDLIAVITAAIAASEGTTTDGFVVRSIKRKKSNKWNG